MVVYNARGYGAFGLWPSSGILKNGTFQKLDQGMESYQFLKCCVLRIPDDGQTKNPIFPSRPYVYDCDCVRTKVSTHVAEEEVC